jgi:hypothetical protein
LNSQRWCPGMIAAVIPDSVSAQETLSKKVFLVHRVL